MIAEHLINKWHFRKITKRNRPDTVDLDQFDVLLRIHDIHYLFYSDPHKAFTLAVRHDRPKGVPGAVKGTVEEWKAVMIPKVIYETGEADALLNAIIV